MSVDHAQVVTVVLTIALYHVLSMSHPDLLAAGIRNQHLGSFETPFHLLAVIVLLQEVDDGDVVDVPPVILLLMKKLQNLNNKKI